MVICITVFAGTLLVKLKVKFKIVGNEFVTFWDSQ